MSELLNSGMVGNIRQNAIENGEDPTSSKINEAIIGAWSNSGLLEGINGLHKFVVAKKLEEAAHVMINYPDTYKNERTAVIVFPVIRRMLSGIIHFQYDSNLGQDIPKDENWLSSTMERNQMLMEVLDVNMVINRIDNTIESSIEFAKGLMGFVEMDEEAEACAIVATQLTEIHMRMHVGNMMVRTEDGVIVVQKK